MAIQKLFRPVGLFELRLIRAADYAILPHQPIFYPVLNAAYAEQIARDWNTTDEASGFMGAVTAFDVDAAYVARFEEHVVGATIHRELWVPAENLDEFNRHIQGPIRVLRAFYGERYDQKRAW